MSGPISLRNVPPDALKLARMLSAQTGLSLNAVFRLSLASGLLIEATRVTPGPDGKLAGWEGSALDLLWSLVRHIPKFGRRGPQCLITDRAFAS